MAQRASLPPARPVHGEAHRAGIGQVALVAAALVIGFVGLRLASLDWDPTRFVAAGDTVTNRTQAPADLHVGEGQGYDGQFFYRLARNPFTREQHEFGISLGRAAYRHQRIGYPFAAWALSGGGQAALVPWTLIAVNGAAIVGIAALGADLARANRRSAWLGLMLALWPGLWVCLARDLADALAAALVLATLVLLRRERMVLATVALASAVLTRESALLLAATIVGSVLLARLPRPAWADSIAARRSPGFALVGVVPIAVYAGWQGFLRSWWPDASSASTETASYLGWPLLALCRQVIDWTGALGIVDLYIAIQAGLTVLVAVTLTALLRDTASGEAHERLALVVSCVVVAMLPTWERSIVFLRYANELFLIGSLVLVSARRPPVEVLRAIIVTLWAMTIVVWVFVE